jgi:hypothetical protein
MTRVGLAKMYDDEQNVVPSHFFADLVSSQALLSHPSFRKPLLVDARVPVRTDKSHGNHGHIRLISGCILMLSGHTAWKGALTHVDIIHKLSSPSIWPILSVRRPARRTSTSTKETMWVY